VLQITQQSNHTPHPDAREAAFYFIERHCPRAGGRERYASTRAVS